MLFGLSIFEFLLGSVLLLYAVVIIIVLAELLPHVFRLLIKGIRRLLGGR